MKPFINLRKRGTCIVFVRNGGRYEPDLYIPLSRFHGGGIYRALSLSEDGRLSSANVMICFVGLIFETAVSSAIASFNSRETLVYDLVPVTFESLLC